MNQHVELVGRGAAVQVNGVLFFFFFQQVKHFSKGQAGLLLLAYFMGGLVGAPVAPRDTLSERGGSFNERSPD